MPRLLDSLRGHLQRSTEITFQCRDAPFIINLMVCWLLGLFSNICIFTVLSIYFQSLLYFMAWFLSWENELFFVDFWNCFHLLSLIFQIIVSFNRRVFQSFGAAVCDCSYFLRTGANRAREIFIHELKALEAIAIPFLLYLGLVSCLLQLLWYWFLH